MLPASHAGSWATSALRCDSAAAAAACASNCLRVMRTPDSSASRRAPPRLGLGVHVLFPRGEERSQAPRDVLALHRQIVALPDVRAEIEHHRRLTIDKQLPVAAP